MPGYMIRSTIQICLDHLILTLLKMKITFLYAPSAKDSSQHRDKMRLKDISSYYALKLTSREVVVDDQ